MSLHLRKPLLSAALVFTVSAGLAQTVADPANLTGEHIAPQALSDALPIDHGAPALQQLLLKLHTRASLMLIVAHPDDEDGGMLTYESRGQGARVAMLTLTRGEGGQNRVSGDFDDALGLIRTQELLAEDRYTGTDQMFGTEADFGFSKTREESLQKWTHQRVLYDAVRAVRLYRPLILASVFLGEPTDGHGHHQVAGEITQEVFAAAADPKVFPEMGLPPWAPLKVYARVPFAPVNEKGMYDYATGKYLPPQFLNYYTHQTSTSKPEANVEIHEGEPSTINGQPALGMDGLTYVQFARQGLALQKTQIGPGVRLAPSGRADSGYIRYGSRVSGEPNQGPGQESGFFAGIDTSLTGIASLAPSASPALRAKLQTQLSAIDRDITAAQKTFNPADLQVSAPLLHDAMISLDVLIQQVKASALPTSEQFNLLHELRIKHVQLNDALVLALNLSATANVDPISSHPSGWVAFQPNHPIGLLVQTSGMAKLKSVLLSGPDGHRRQLLNAMNRGEGARTLRENLDLGPDTPLTRPYFSRPNIEQPFYNISNPDLRNASATPAPFTVSAEFEFQGIQLEVKSIVSAGNETTPATVVPALSVAIQPSIGIDSTAPGVSRPLDLTVSVRPVFPSQARVALKLPPTWTSQPRTVRFEQSGANSLQSSAFLLHPGNLQASARYGVQAVADSGGRQYSEGIRAVGYPGVTPTNLFTPATYTAVAVDVRTATNLRVAYLPGTGDDVAAFLPNLGVTPTLLAPADLTPTSLARFNTVVLGVRAYAAHPDRAGEGSQALLDFARKGGTVIVQYNTSVYGSTSAPAPITVPGDPGHNVVVEADPVTLLVPNSPLLSWPNRITSADFNNWVEERGHGFATTWGSAFTSLLEMHDPGQDPQRGGLLVANIGRGHYVYCALALYRQLPEGVPGAYRLFANLLSLSQAKGLTRMSTDKADKDQ